MPTTLPGIPVPVRWTDDGLAVHLLDQTLLPREERHLRLETVGEVAEAISALRVRGAPAIGIAAAMGLAMGTMRRIEEGFHGSENPEIRWLEDGFQADAGILRVTRPTAVNLSWALDRMGRVFRAEISEGHGHKLGLKSLLHSPFRLLEDG